MGGGEVGPYYRETEPRLSINCHYTKFKLCTNVHTLIKKTYKSKGNQQC